MTAILNTRLVALRWASAKSLTLTLTLTWSLTATATATHSLGMAPRERRRFSANYRFVLFALLLGCGAADAAVEPIWGKQPCDHCHMLLSDPRNAAQLVTITGGRLYFDDVGCMVEHLARDAHSVAHVWVRDARGAWIDAHRARYRAGVETPMGYGVQVSANGELDFVHVQAEIARKRYAENAR